MKISSAELNKDLERQASLLGKYLVGKNPEAQACQLYAQFIGSSAPKLSSRDKKLLGFINAHPWSLGLVDSGLTILNRNSEIRRRLFVMFSILETQPADADYFLPQARKRPYIIKFMADGAVGVLKVLFGSILIVLVA